MACNCAKIIEMQVENEKLIKTMEVVISKLKDENSHFKSKVSELESTIKFNKPLCSHFDKEIERQILEFINKISGFLICDKTLDSVYDVVKRLKEENEKLKMETESLKLKAQEYRDKFEERLDLGINMAHFLHCQPNSKDIYNKVVEIKTHLDKLKAENQQLSGISGQLKVECKEAHTSDDVVNCFTCLSKWYLASDQKNKELQEYNESLSRAYRRHVEKIDLLNVENAQLKARLQNRDKASQIEHKQICQTCQGTKRVAIQSRRMTGGTRLVIGNSAMLLKPCPDCSPQYCEHSGVELSNVQRKPTCKICKNLKVMNMGDYSLICMTCCKEEISEKLKNSPVFETPKEINIIW
jgi:hypothetical protein